jgi:hypothetical protein
MRGAILLRSLCGAVGLLLAACGSESDVIELASVPSDISSQPMFANALADAPIMPVQRKVSDALSEGVVVVVSKGSQQMHVFRNGSLWKSTRVSTGKPGKETPSGVFAILQKKEFHRSNLYSNAPMPFMQRLTWDGVAIHAGAVPNYPASHGCIRVPLEFATELYGVTGPVSTAVIVVDQELASEGAALALARRTDEAIPIHPSLLWQKVSVQARAEPAAQVHVSKVTMFPRSERPEATERKARPGEQTIQLAAARSHSQAQAQWNDLARQRPEVAQMRMAIVPATVDSQQYFRLRASAPDAHSRCDALKSAGIACFPVS